MTKIGAIGWIRRYSFNHRILEQHCFLVVVMKKLNGVIWIAQRFSRFHGYGLASCTTAASSTRSRQPLGHGGDTVVHFVVQGDGWNFVGRPQLLILCCCCCRCCPPIQDLEFNFQAHAAGRPVRRGDRMSRARLPIKIDLNAGHDAMGDITIDAKREFFVVISNNEFQAVGSIVVLVMIPQGNGVQLVSELGAIEVGSKSSIVVHQVSHTARQGNGNRVVVIVIVLINMIVR
mmetsp:Transcript_8891/g.24627  ORF Transcript_8891/g.24627 Transcript_8891/m.24627 type:complete len:232 (+) Transcript_8891:1773-2468(+)